MNSESAREEADPGFAQGWSQFGFGDTLVQICKTPADFQGKWTQELCSLQWLDSDFIPRNSKKSKSQKSNKHYF